MQRGEEEQSREGGQRREAGMRGAGQTMALPGIDKDLRDVRTPGGDGPWKGHCTGRGWGPAMRVAAAPAPAM